MRKHSVTVMAMAFFTFFVGRAIDVRAATAETILYQFGSAGATDAMHPSGSLVADSSGVLYGVSTGGGLTKCGPSKAACGTVFRLIPPQTGQTAWTEEVIYRFTGQTGDGWSPTTGVVLDSSGAVYGTTQYGGTGKCVDSYGTKQQCGTVFKLTPPLSQGEPWNETIIYLFRGKPDGAAPSSDLVLSNGVLYGSTSFGGSHNCYFGTNGTLNLGCGAVFSLTPPAMGSTNWSESVLYSFAGPPDGDVALGHLSIDGSGNLYGTTLLGGSFNVNGFYFGTVFQVSPPSNGGSWSEQVVFNFGANTGAEPYGGVTVGSSGVLYGSTYVVENAKGNFVGNGSVFSLTPPKSGGTWAFSQLYDFKKTSNGHYPLAAITIDAGGNLYGTCYEGGSQDHGTVFKLLNPGNGTSPWNAIIEHSFKPTAKNPDGYGPRSTIAFDGTGQIYGTTQDGGLYNGGVAFSLTP